LIDEMSLLRYCILICGFVLIAGCIGGSPANTSTPSATPTQSATPTPSVTPPQSGTAVGERAIAAEQARIEQQANTYKNLTGLRFGTIEPADSEVVSRNSTGVIAEVSVGYSASIDCDGDGEPDSAVDGANTVTTYFITENNSRLTEVSQDFLNPVDYC
jgi:hypothetical protein